MKDLLKKINWKQAKYIIPAIVLPPLLFIGYQICSLIDFEKEETDTAITTENVNTDLPGINESATDIKNKYDAMLDGFGKVTDYTGVSGVEKEEEVKETVKGIYSDREKDIIDSVNAAQAKQMEELNQLLAEQRRIMTGGGSSNGGSQRSSQRRVISRAEADDDDRINDNEEMDALTRRMQMIQKMANGEKILTEEEKQERKLEEARKVEIKRIQDSIALANAPVAVNKAGATGEQYFNTVVDKEEDPNLIRARVDEMVKVRSGSRLRIRLSEDVEIEGEVLKKGSYLYATVTGFNAQRVMAQVTSAKLGNNIKKIALAVYDLDCMEGFYVPASNFREMSRNIGANSMNMNVNMNSDNDDQSLQSIAMQSLQQAFQATTSAIGNNIRQNKARIKFNTEIYLVDQSNK